MTDPHLFPLEDYWLFYAGFVGFVLLMLALDLGVFHRRAHVVRLREAAAWSAVWITLALVFSFLFYHYLRWHLPNDPRVIALPGYDPEAWARRSALEFLTGYVVEKALSVDNIFVFVVVFRYFAIPSMYQHRVLFFGILGALVFRAVFIVLGAVLLRYDWVALLFGLFLVVTGFRVMVVPEKPLEPDKNPVIRLLRRLVPVTPRLEGRRFFVRHGGVLMVTPLLVTLVFIEITDVIFAVDSVPAIFAVTDEPLIVFTSNVFAILGLRAMYFLLAGVMDKFRHLKYGLGVILMFVGLKMAWLNELFDGKFPIAWSLGIIGGVLLVAIAASLVHAAHEDVRRGNRDGIL